MLALRENVNVNIKDSSYAVTPLAGVINGVTQALGGLPKRLSKGCLNGNLLNSVLGIADGTVDDIGKGFAHGSTKSYGAIENINV